MCFEVLPLNPHGAGDDDEKDEDDDISAMDMDGTDVKTSKLLLLAIISVYIRCIFLLDVSAVMSKSCSSLCR